jgi:hypothetical protein
MRQSKQLVKPVDKFTGPPNRTCSTCGKRFFESEYAALSRAIMQEDTAVCSRECWLRSKGQTGRSGQEDPTR